MSTLEGEEQQFQEIPGSTEKGNATTFKLSIATYNIGNGKRGMHALPNAMARMTQLSSDGPGIIGFQEVPPLHANELDRQLPTGWEMHHFPNATDPELSMAMAYDASFLRLQCIEKFTLQQIPAWHRIYEIPRREQPLERQAQMFHFTLLEDPSVHIVLVNAHLSVKGHLAQRQKEMEDVLEHLQSFLHKQHLIDPTTDHQMADTSAAIYVIGDFNTPGRVGSQRNRRQIERLGLFERGFTKLNDLLDPTSNALSSVLHKAHDIMGDQAFSLAQQVGETARKTVRRQKIFASLIDAAQQHRDHIFSKLYGLQELAELENKVFGPPDHQIDSDHFMVFSGSVLQKMDQAT